jgi:hypothetical protein
MFNPAFIPFAFQFCNDYRGNNPDMSACVEQGTALAFRDFASANDDHGFIANVKMDGEILHAFLLVTGERRRQGETAASINRFIFSPPVCRKPG